MSGMVSGTTYKNPTPLPLCKILWWELGVWGWVVTQIFLFVDNSLRKRSYRKYQEGKVVPHEISFNKDTNSHINLNLKQKWKISRQKEEKYFLLFKIIFPTIFP